MTVLNSVKVWSCMSTGERLKPLVQLSKSPRSLTSDATPYHATGTCLMTSLSRSLASLSIPYTRTARAQKPDGISSKMIPCFEAFQVHDFWSMPYASLAAIST